MERLRYTFFQPGLSLRAANGVHAKYKYIHASVFGWLQSIVSFQPGASTIMLSRVLQGLQGCRGAILTQFRRNLGVTAVLSQKAAAADLDPIQQLFLDKVREYAKK